MCVISKRSQNLLSQLENITGYHPKKTDGGNDQKSPSARRPQKGCFIACEASYPYHGAALGIVTNEEKTYRTLPASQRTWSFLTQNGRTGVPDPSRRSKGLISPFTLVRPPAGRSAAGSQFTFSGSLLAENCYWPWRAAYLSAMGFISRRSARGLSQSSRPTMPGDKSAKDRVNSRKRGMRSAISLQA